VGFRAALKLSAAEAFCRLGSEYLPGKPQIQAGTLTADDAPHMKQPIHFRTLTSIALVAIGALSQGCGSEQSHPATAEEVRDGEAIPSPPPVNPNPGSTSSPTAPTVPPPAVDEKPAAAATPAKETLSEAQVAMIADLANGGEVEQGKLAQGKAKAPAVKKFADMMVKHHTDAKNEQDKLFKKLNLTPAESETGKALKADADKTLATLRSADAAGFDAAYAQSQVDAHQKVLDLLNAQLIPAAKSAELSDSLNKMKATVESHLSQAKALQPAK
jgi:putative membrane protein